MAKMRFAVAAVAATIAVGSLSVTGCASHESGSNVKGDAPSGGEMVADVAVARPLTLWASAIGAVGWVVTLPFTLPSGSAGDTAKSWIGDPLKYTFCRPAGEMEDNSDKPCFGGEG